MALSGNKGEWSEVYAFFKVLSDGVLFPGDQNLDRIDNLIYPIIKILRTETSGNYEYTLDQDIVIVSSENKELARISLLKFKANSLKVLKAINSESGTFNLPDVEEFMTSISCFSIKAKSSKKTDITIKIHDEKTGQQPVLGFSIKSRLGGQSTLLNAGKTTNFKYRINGQISEQTIKEINELVGKGKIKKRVSAIYENACSLEFEEISNGIFANNLILIDSLLPVILSRMLLEFYSSNLSKTSELLNEIKKNNPLKFDLSKDHPFYSYKLKHLLTDIAVGMMPSKVWKGDYDATGGYLIVKEDGDVVCYHLYNRNEFENYLIQNTKFETASSGRHDFGSIYKEENNFYINLNLQIRFLK